MKVFLFLSLFAVFFIGTISAQKSRPLKKVMVLTMPEGEGANGGGVAYQVATKRYYAAFAGNATFVLGVFNEKGKLLEGGSTTTEVDLRGFWFNTKKNKLQGNGYGETGWFEYQLSPKGIPTGVKVLFEGANQPHEQSAGAFNGKANEVYFFDGEEISIYDAATAEVKGSKSLEEMLEDTDDFYDEVFEDYSPYSVLYTGVLNQEIGLVNHAEQRIELFSLEGKRTAMLDIPQEQPVYPTFNVAYANGMYWFFNKETRVWIGYK